MKDKINPSHYKGNNGMEVIDILQEFLTAEEMQGYCKGNIIKYTLRCSKKNGGEDVRKAEWYCRKLASLMEKV